MEHINPIFLNLSLILVVAGVTTLLFKYLKQPIVLGYIVAGFLTGPHFTFFPTVLDQQTITIWGEIGVVFLLFALGLEFNLKKIKKVIGTGAVTAITEALVMMAIGILAGRLMGWKSMDALFLGGMISISSTSIIIKAFDDMKLKTKRFSQIVTGVLVFEDLVAIMLLVLLSTLAVTSQFDGSDMFYEMAKLLLFLILWYTGGIYIIPTLLRKLKKLINDETLLVVSIGLCLAMVVIAAKAGFSAALGAFVMGSIMSETDESERIHKLISPIKDLFAAVFFISVGMLVEPKMLVEHIWPILIITAIVLTIKPLAATIGVLLSGKPLKQSMQAGACLSQIGEFSFIIASLGLSLGVINAYLYPIIVSVSIITIFLTPYCMRIAEPLYERLYRMAPTGWQVVMQEYGTGSKTLDHDSDWKQLLKSYVSRILIHSGWLIAVVLLTFNLLIPFARNTFGDSTLVEVCLCVVTLIAMSPFLYALMVKRITSDVFDRLWTDHKYARGPLITLRLSRFVIGALFIGVVLGRFLSLKLTLLAPVVVGIVVIIALSQRLKKHYYSMEQQFLANIDKTKRRSGIAIPQQLVGDIHLEYIDLMMYSSLVGLTIRQIHRQFHTGAQVISITRREQRLDLPSNEETLHAGDRVLIVGNDQQIMNFRNCAEAPSPVPMSTPSNIDLDLYQVTISDSSPLCGEKAHVSELVNKYDFMLVGIQRGTSRFIRARQDLVFAPGDTLWVVGNKKSLHRIF